MANPPTPASRVPDYERIQRVYPQLIQATLTKLQGLTAAASNARGQRVNLLREVRVLGVLSARAGREKAHAVAQPRILAGATIIRPGMASIGQALEGARRTYANAHALFVDPEQRKNVQRALDELVLLGVAYGVSQVAVKDLAMQRALAHEGLVEDLVGHDVMLALTHEEWYANAHADPREVPAAGG